MPDEFETVSASREQRSREIEVMRAHYRRHREALKRMAADAPTDALAQEYQRLVMSIDGALMKLDELEGVAPPPRLSSEPGMKPLVQTNVQPIAEPVEDDLESTQVDYEPPESHPVSNARLALIVAAGVLVLALIAWLIWRASSDRAGEATTTTVADTIAVTETVPVEPGTVVPEPDASPAQVLSVTPSAHDYGTIRKGTRATRQYEVVNGGDAPVAIVVARSACRCLYYEYGATVPARGRETITVTVDGAKANAGQLAETVKVSARDDPKIVTTFDVTATIQ